MKKRKSTRKSKHQNKIVNIIMLLTNVYQKFISLITISFTKRKKENVH